MTGKQRANKRKVFEDSDSEKTSEPPAVKKSKAVAMREEISPACSSKREKKQDSTPNKQFHNLKVSSYSLFKRTIIWPYLTIRGPYAFLFDRIGNSSPENRPWFNLLRQISLKIYEKLIEYRKVDIPRIIHCFDESEKPEVNYVVQLAETMSQKVFRFKDNEGLLIDLYPTGMILPIQDIFSNRLLKVACCSEKEILGRLRSICHSKRIDVTDEELEEVVSKEKSTKKIIIERFKAPKIFPNREVHSEFKQLNVSSRLAFLSLHLLKRNIPPSSLWMCIPCEENEHLLGWVLEYGLIQLLPIDARAFLDKWIYGVRKRMRKRLSTGDLRRTIELVMSEGDKNKNNLPLADLRVEQLLVKIVENALNSKELKLFTDEWQNHSLSLLKDAQKSFSSFGKYPNSHQIFQTVCEKLDPTSLHNISSLFSDTPSSQSMLSNVLLQLYRFLICFILSTLRHVFRFNPRSFTFSYDGTLDDEVKDFQSYDNESICGVRSTKNSQAEADDSFSEPAVPVVHVIKPRKILLPTPNYSPICPEERHPSFVLPEYWSNRSSIAQTSSPSPYDHPMLPNNEISESVVAHDRKKTFFNAHKEMSSSESLTIKPKFDSFKESPLPEITEEELTKARALRPSSVASGLDDEGIPKKWIDAYNITLEWNKELKEELVRVKARLEKLS
uniref:Uncharacterized protein n=1 Tax=Caenorhabditis tropicalis TaxID=1561998 RepID=A0A1I7UY10_9PELO